MESGNCPPSVKDQARGVGKLFKKDRKYYRQTCKELKKSLKAMKKIEFLAERVTIKEQLREINVTQGNMQKNLHDLL